MKAEVTPNLRNREAIPHITYYLLCGHKSINNYRRMVSTEINNKANFSGKEN